MSFEIGRTYGCYEIIDVLDSSKDGVAYKVKNVLANRLEVLKVLPGTSKDDQERVERFLREIKVHARLIHPNIVTFYNATELDGQLVMTSELVEGTTLAGRLELGPPRWSEAVDWMGQLLSALECAHSHGIVHRDVTPSNIILVPEGVVRLTGFGLAKGSADAQLTVAGAMVGSLKYVAPEQVKGVSQLDGRADIYSAGIVLYEMLVGRPPFNQKSQFDIMLAHMTTVPPPPSTANPHVPIELDSVVRKALAKEPSQRFQSAGEFRKALLEAKARIEGAPANLPSAAGECSTNVAQAVPAEAQAPAPIESSSNLPHAESGAQILGTPAVDPPAVVAAELAQESALALPPLSAAGPAPRILMLAGVFIFVVALVVFFAFR